MTKPFKQVFQAPGGFFFRITLPVAKFQTEERWDRPEDAAFNADIFKLLLVKRYGLSGTTMWPSLTPEVFSTMLSEIGVDRASPDSLLAALPKSCTDFLMDGGHEQLIERQKNHSAMSRVIS